MNRGTRDTICATIGLLIVIALLTTVAALDSPGEMDEPNALSSAAPEPRVEMPEDSLPAEEYAYCSDVCLGLFELTAYCPCSACCGKNDGITATGTVATEGRTVAVDPTVIPYGTTIEVIYADGSSARYVAEDCGGASMRSGSWGVSPSLCESAKDAHVDGRAISASHHIFNSWACGRTDCAQHRKRGLGRFGNTHAEHGPKHPYIVFATSQQHRKSAIRSALNRNLIRCAYCDSVTLALDLNGVDAHVCPLCGAVFARRYGNTYSFIADLKGAQGVKELLHSVRPHDPLYRSIITA